MLKILKEIDNKTLTDAIKVLVCELKKGNEVYNGFVCSIKSALEKQNEYGIPFEPTEDIARKILDFMIGDC